MDKKHNRSCSNKQAVSRSDRQNRPKHVVVLKSKQEKEREKKTPRPPKAISENVHKDKEEHDHISEIITLYSEKETKVGSREAPGALFPTNVRTQ